MKHITIVLDEETYERFEEAAARRHTSVSDLVRNAAIEKIGLSASPVSPEEFERLVQKQEEIRKSIGHFSASDRLSRDELYESRFRK